MAKPVFLDFEGLPQYSDDQMLEKANAFYDHIRARRTIRDFSDRPVPEEVIKQCVLAAGTAPNGANLQPWHFAIVKDAEIKKRIRFEAEKEEKEFYSGRAPQEWLDALEHLGTDEHKPFLETAPYLIVIFMQTHLELPDGKKVKHYYASESVGIATGFLINALHSCGLATLTHTPSPMNFLNEILDRPKYERPFLILVAGFPTDDAQVPRIEKKPFDRVATIH